MLEVVIWAMMAFVRLMGGVEKMSALFCRSIRANLSEEPTSSEGTVNYIS